MSLLVLVLIVLLVLALAGGVWGTPAYGPMSWSPAFFLIVLLLVLLLTGHVRLR